MSWSVRWWMRVSSWRLRMQLTHSPRFRLPQRESPRGACSSACLAGMPRHRRSERVPPAAARPASTALTPRTLVAFINRSIPPLPRIAAHAPADSVSHPSRLSRGVEAVYIAFAAFVVPVDPVVSSNNQQAALRRQLYAPSRPPLCTHPRRRLRRAAVSPAPGWPGYRLSMSDSSSLRCGDESLWKIRSRSEMEKASDVAIEKLVSSFRARW